MRDVVTQSGRKASRIGLAASPDLDSRCVEIGFASDINYFFFYNSTFSNFMDGLRPLLKRNREDVIVGCGSEARDQKSLRRDLDRIRKRLDVDILDIFHVDYVSPGDDEDTLFGETGAISEIERWRDSGLVRYVAASVHSRSLAVALVQSGRVELLMTRYNMAHRGAEEKVLPAAEEAGIPVTAFTCTRWGTLLEGHPGWGVDRPVPKAADCYRFVLQHPAVRIALTNPGIPKRLYENLSVLREGDISPEQFRLWEEYGRLVYGDGKHSFETRWP